MDHRAVTPPPDVAWLYSLQQTGIKLGLENISALCADVGNPQRACPMVHVAGTNGKGSVSSLLAAILRNAGFSVGLYTSPHLVDFTERIRVDGEPMSLTALEELAEALRPRVEALGATFFEATTAMAFRHFADRGVDIAVIETGLGGRFDATNVVTPVVSIITSIDFDHMEFLGTTLEQIAMEKAGIIKPGVPVCFNAAAAGAREVILATARGRGCDAHELATHDVDALRIRDLDCMEVRFSERVCTTPVTTPLVGRHQASNLGLALLAAHRLAERLPGIDATTVAAGVADVRRLAGLRGRLERLSIRPEVVVDVCHNPAGVEALVKTWTTLRRPDRTHLVLGLMGTKDAGGIMQVLARHRWKSLTAVEADTHGALAAEALATIARGSRMTMRPAGRVFEAVEAVIDNADEADAVLLFGSHYVVGEFLHHADQRNFFSGY